MDRALLTEHYRKNFDPNVFIDTYAKGRLEIEIFFCTNLFKVFDQGKIKGPRCVDVGAGPTVHRLGYASRFCDQLVHTDFLDQNLEFVRQWISSNDLDDKHRHLMKFVAKQEGYGDEDEGAKKIEARLRSKIVSVLQVDILDDESVRNLSQHGGLFDCAISHACIESSCRSYDDALHALKNIARILKPGAALVLEGFLNLDDYEVGISTFPALRWTSEMVKNALTEAGFKLELMEVENKPVVFATEELNVDVSFALSYKC